MKTVYYYTPETHDEYAAVVEVNGDDTSNITKFWIYKHDPRVWVRKQYTRTHTGGLDNTINEKNKISKEAAEEMMFLDCL